MPCQVPLGRPKSHDLVLNCHHVLSLNVEAWLARPVHTTLYLGSSFHDCEQRRALLTPGVLWVDPAKWLLNQFQWLVRI